MCCTLQRADATVQETAAVAVPSEQDANYFFEPLLRSLVLGMGAGMICETAHQLIKVREHYWLATTRTCTLLSKIFGSVHIIAVTALTLSML